MRDIIDNNESVRVVYHMFVPQVYFTYQRLDPMPSAPCSQEKGFQSKMTFIFCEAEWRDQWRPTPGVSTRPMKADSWAHPPFHFWLRNRLWWE